MNHVTPGDPEKQQVSTVSEQKAFVVRLIDENRAGIRGLLETEGLVEYERDILQDAFIRMIKEVKKGTIRDPKAYLFKVIFSLCSRQHKHRNRTKVVSSDEMMRCCQELIVRNAFLNWEKEKDKQQQLQRLVTFMNEELTEEARTILHYRYFENLNYKEISQQMNKKVPAIRKVASRAIKKLRTLMKPQTGQP